VIKYKQLINQGRKANFQQNISNTKNNEETRSEQLTNFRNDVNSRENIDHNDFSSVTFENQELDNVSQNFGEENSKLIALMNSRNSVIKK
jgi:hypothetical protein